MASGLLIRLLGVEAAQWRIESAGTWALDGQPPSRRSLQVLESRGVTLSGHRARTVSHSLLASFNLILVMESGHKEALSVEFPDLAGKIYLLSEMAGEEVDIADPMGGSLLDFEAAAAEMERLLSLGLERIRELAGD